MKKLILLTLMVLFFGPVAFAQSGKAINSNVTNVQGEIATCKICEPYQSFRRKISILSPVFLFLMLAFYAGLKNEEIRFSFDKENDVVNP